MTKASTLFSKFVSSFIEKNCSEDIVELWNDETKEEFVKMIEKELKKNTKVKKEKKPVDAPKGARSSYILFCMEERPKINKEFPELSNQDKVKLMAERWNEAKEDEDILKTRRERPRIRRIMFHLMAEMTAKSLRKRQKEAKPATCYFAKTKEQK